MKIPQKMRAMVFEKQGEPLRLRSVPVPKPEAEQVLLRVTACGICRTDLHILDGELTEPKLPLIPGHEIIGTVVQRGEKVKGLREGDRVGIPWLAQTCGNCRYCKSGKENLCDTPSFTGYTVNGGYAEYALANENYAFPIAASYDDMEAAPLLCAGMIGYRSYRIAAQVAGDGFKTLGIYGFGAAAHILVQVALYQGKRVYAFTRPGDEEAKKLALQLGAAWAGDSKQSPPEKLDAAIIFAPVGPLVPAALKATEKGGSVICAGIHMSDIPAFPYSILWGERTIRSVANLTRRDGIDFLHIAPKIPVKTEIEIFQLEEANEALKRLREGKINGAAVLTINKG